MVTSENTPTESKKVIATDQGAYLSVRAGQTIQLNTANLDLIEFSQDGNDLIVTSIADGQKIILGDFFIHALSDTPPQLILADGEKLTTDELVKLVDDFNVDQVLPAAGPGASGAGGGASFSSYSDNGIGDGISTEDLLLPTSLEFSSFEIQEEFGVLADDISDDIIFNMTASPITISEEAQGETTFTLTMIGDLTAGNTATITLNLGGDAESGTDYTGFLDALADAVGNTDGVSLEGADGALIITSDFDGTLAIKVTAIDDELEDNGEDITVTLGEADVVHGTASITTPSATVEITDLDAAITFSIAADKSQISEEIAGAEEDGEGITYGESTTFTLTMEGDLAEGNTASVVITADGLATSGEDYSDFYSAVQNAITAKGEDSGVSLEGSTLTFTSDFDGTLAIKVTAIDDNEVEGIEEITVSLSDATVAHGTTSIDEDAATVEIIETDDVPVAVDDEYTIEGPNPTHAVFVMDTSGSMEEELVAMKDALLNLAKTLFASNENTIITLVEFNNDATIRGEVKLYTLDDVEAVLDSINEAAGGTNYKLALDAVRQVDFESGYNKSVYFISDGDPDTVGNTHNQTMVGITDFNDWVETQTGGVDVYSVALGDAINENYLGLFDTTDEDNTANKDFLIVVEAEDLDGSFTTNSSVSGNVLGEDDGQEDDDFGDDGPAQQPLQSITYGGVVYTLLVPNSGTVDGNDLTLDTEFGQLVFNFDTGDFTFIATKTITEDQMETITYTIEDGDGSTASANLIINIEAVTVPVATPDTVITNITSGDIEIPDDALLANDNDADGDILTIDKVGNAVEGDAVHADTVVFTPEPTVKAATSTYDFRDTDAGHTAQSFTFNPNDDANPFNDLTRTELGDGLDSNKLSKISFSDNSRFTTKDPSHSENSIFQADFIILDTVEFITEITVSLEQSHSNGWWVDDAQLVVWNWADGNYELLDETGEDDPNTWDNDEIWSKTLFFDDGAADYVGDGGIVTIAFYNEKQGDISRIDYVKVEVTTETPSDNPMSFDYSVTDSDFESNDATVTIETVEGDSLFGTGDDEILLAGEGDDILNGGNGDDYLVGNAGDDELEGGAGADVFAYTSGADGNDSISDFVRSEDIIDLDGLFDVMGVGDEDNRADQISLDNTSSPGETTLTVDGTTDFSITINGDLGSGTLSVSELAAQGIHVGDES